MLFDSEKIDMVYSFLNCSGEEEVGCGRGEKSGKLNTTVSQASEYDGDTVCFAEERDRCMSHDTILSGALT